MLVTQNRLFVSGSMSGRVVVKQTRSRPFDPVFHRRQSPGGQVFDRAFAHQFAGADEIANRVHRLFRAVAFLQGQHLVLERKPLFVEERLAGKRRELDQVFRRAEGQHRVLQRRLARAGSKRGSARKAACRACGWSWRHTAAARCCASPIRPRFSQSARMSSKSVGDFAERLRLFPFSRRHEFRRRPDRRGVVAAVPATLRSGAEVCRCRLRWSPAFPRRCGRDPRRGSAGTSRE